MNNISDRMTIEYRHIIKNNPSKNNYISLDEKTKDKIQTLLNDTLKKPSDKFLVFFIKNIIRRKILTIILKKKEIIKNLSEGDEFKKCSVCFSLPSVINSNGFSVFPEEQLFECSHNSICIRCFTHKLFNGKCPICRKPKRPGVIVNTISNIQNNEVKKSYHDFEHMVEEVRRDGKIYRRY